MTNKPTYNELVAELDRKARQTQLKEQEEAENRLKKNKDFVQIEKKNLKAFRYLAIENPTAVAVLFALAEHMNTESAVMISYSGLELLTGYSRTTLSKAIKLLEERNWIEIVKVGQSNVYKLNSGAFWRSYGNRKITSFNAKIVAIDTEQIQKIERDGQQIKLNHFPVVQQNEVVLLGNNEDEEPPTNEEMDV